MDERAINGKTAVDRISAVARKISHSMYYTHSRPPDYADFRDALGPYIHRELLLARIDEARMAGSAIVTSRVKELSSELMKIEVILPNDDRH